MKNFLMIFAALAIVTSARFAMAGTMCEWGTTPTASEEGIVAQEGQEVRISATCCLEEAGDGSCRRPYKGDSSGIMEIPEELEGAAVSRFVPDPPAPGGLKVTFSAQAGTFTFTAEIGERREERTFTVTVVEPPNTTASDDDGPTAKEFKEVRDDVANLKSRAVDWGRDGRLQLGVATIFGPNNDYVTKVTTGVIVQVGGQPKCNEAHWVCLQIDALWSSSWTGAPINPDLRPTSMYAPMWVRTIGGRVGAAFVPTKYLHILPALEIAALTEGREQHVVRQQANGDVLETEAWSDTRPAFIPQGEVSVVLGRWVALYGNLAAVIPTEAAEWEVGSRRKSAYSRFRGGGGLKVWF